MTNVSDSTIHLQGIYQINGKSLVNTDDKVGNRLVIGTRKTPTPTKPTHYLLMKLGKQHTYVSSMYPTDKEYHYQIEYRGVNYDMVLNGGSYIITQTKN